MKWVFMITILVVSNPILAKCKKKSSSQKVSQQVFDVAARLGINDDAPFKLRATTASDCEEKEKFYKVVYEMLPQSLQSRLLKLQEKFKEQITGEKGTKNLARLRKEIIGFIDGTEVTIDGVPRKVIRTNNGNLAWVGQFSQTSAITQVSDSVKNYLSRNEEELSFTGFIGRRDAVESREAQPFRWKINGDELDELEFDSKNKLALGLGYMDIKGDKTTDDYFLKVKGKASYHEEDYFIRAQVVRCEDSFCLNTGHKFEYDTKEKKIKMNHSMKVCSGTTRTEACVGVFHNGVEYGTDASLKGRYGANFFDLGVRRSNLATSGELKFDLGQNVSGYARKFNQKAVDTGLQEDAEDSSSSSRSGRISAVEAGVVLVRQRRSRLSSNSRETSYVISTGVAQVEDGTGQKATNGFIKIDGFLW